MVVQSLVVLLALCAALCAAIGIVVRQRATTDVPPEQGVSAVMLSTLLRRPLWWAGTGSAVAGYGFQALALAKGSLMLVQPLLVAALLFALPLSARLANRRVTRAEWGWALLLGAALAVFVVLARPRPGDYTGSVWKATVASVVCLVLVAGCVVLATRHLGRVRAMLLAAAVGVLLGVAAVMTKVVMYYLATHSVLALLITPAPYVLALLGVTLTLIQQSAFHAGALQMSVPTMLMLEPVVAVLLGTVVLGEHVEASPAEAVPLAIAVVAMAAATIALGRGAGAYEEQLAVTMVRQPSEATSATG